MDENINNIKMIKTDSKTINVLSKIKGWHLIRGTNFSYTDIVRNLILKDAERKGLIDNDGNANYQPPESGGERDTKGGIGSGKTQPNMDEKGGGIPGKKL